MSSKDKEKGRAVFDDKWVNEHLVNILNGNEPQAWVGTRPPFDMIPIDLLNSTNCRVSPNLHQKFSIVWFIEHFLCDLDSLTWRLALEESICLIKEKGKLIIKTRQTHDFTVPKLKNYLGRKMDIDCAVDFEYQYSDGTWIFVFDILRKNYDIYSSDSWSFAILTTGKRKENVVRFLESIRVAHEYYEKKNDVEIIICGPKDKMYEEYDVNYLDISGFRDDYLAEISKKKNIIAEVASNENLLITHDRYVLPKDFFVGFSKYGYDFGFLTVRQSYVNGDEYPSYCRLDQCLLWGQPTRVDNYNKVYDTSYLNGGLLIFKTKLLRSITFNKLLMWNQMEDVELAKEYISRSVLPRVNFLVEAETIGISSDYTASFKTEHTGSLVSGWGIDNTPFIISTKFANTKLVKKAQKIAIHFPRSLKRNKVYRKLVAFILSK